MDYKTNSSVLQFFLEHFLTKSDVMDILILSLLECIPDPIFGMKIIFEFYSKYNIEKEGLTKIVGKF